MFPPETQDEAPGGTRSKNSHELPSRRVDPERARRWIAREENAPRDSRGSDPRLGASAKAWYFSPACPLTA